MTAEAATTIKELASSPLKKWRHKHCNQCGDHCIPGSERFQACILCDLIDTITRGHELANPRGTRP